MEYQIPAISVSEFGDLIKDASGIDINVCYQCRKCTSGCPVAYAMDYTPAQILHAARLGLKDPVLGSDTIWLCASCETCVTRCPQDLDLPKVMDSLRAMALRARVRPGVPEVAIFPPPSLGSIDEVASFYRSSLRNIRLFGRMYELGIIGQWKLATWQFLKDLKLGLRMFRKGKLKLMPDFGGFWTIRGIFSRVRKLERK